jgi:hypothetical protein
VRCAVARSDMTVPSGNVLYLFQNTRKGILGLP